VHRATFCPAFAGKLAQTVVHRAPLTGTNFKTLLLALKTMFTQHSHECCNIDVENASFPSFTFKANKVSKSAVVEKVIMVADF